MISGDAATALAPGASIWAQAAIVRPVTGTGSASPPAARHGAGQPASAGFGPVAYVGTNQGVVPLNTSTNTAGQLIRMPGQPGLGAVAFNPRGKVIYAAWSNHVEVISTASGKILTQIGLPGTPADIPTEIAFTPDGAAASVVGTTVRGIVPIDTATETALAPIRTPQRPATLAITPDGRRAYVVPWTDMAAADPRGTTVLPIKTSTNTALAPIKVGANTGIIEGVAVTPDGKTAYVARAMTAGISVTPIDVAADKSLQAIAIPSGLAVAVLAAPDGRMAYALSTQAVIPIDTATNRALAPIRLPRSVAGYADTFAITPDSATLLVLTPGAVTLISTATGRAGTPIWLTSRGPTTVIAVTPDGREAYVGVRGGVVPISLSTYQAGKTISIPGLGRSAPGVIVTPYPSQAGQLPPGF
jgi:DNA-binding beta-propeller fold protein YncE